jgi:hypothetical protein
LRSNFRRSGSEFIILRIPKTEKWPFWFWTVTGDNIFFQLETNYFCLTTLIQLSMAHIKITFLIYFFDRVPQLPAFNGSGYKINSENTIINIFVTINNFDLQGPLCIINF